MCEIHVIYFAHAMSIVFFGLIDLVDADRVYVSALCARPFRQMIVEAFLFIQIALHWSQYHSMPGNCLSRSSPV